MTELYKEGADDTEVAVAIGMPMREFQSRLNSDPLFEKLVLFGRLAAKAWWTRMARKAVAAGSNGGYSYWALVMKNQHGWSEKAETSDGKPVTQLSKDELTTKLAELTRKIKKVPDRLQLQEILGNELN